MRAGEKDRAGHRVTGEQAAEKGTDLQPAGGMGYSREASFQEEAVGSKCPREVRTPGDRTYPLSSLTSSLRRRGGRGSGKS